MGIRLIQFLRGYVTLLLSGQFIERFINICMHRGIFLWDIRRAPSGTKLKMSLRAFKTIPPIARKTHTRVRILEKRGLPIRLAACKRRSLFAGGLLFAVVFLYVSSLFLWSVEIEGTERTDPQVLAQVLSELGVRPGAYKKNIVVREVKENALLRIDTLSWLWVDIRGCRARVQVMEKTPAPQITAENACDIVAQSDGIVCEIIATEGQTKVAVGDTVRRGQVLISAVFTSTRENIPARYTHAAGRVFARTWYEKSITVPRTKTEKSYTENTHTKRALRFGQFSVPLSWPSSIPYQHFERRQAVHELAFFGIKTGIAYSSDQYLEYTESDVEITTEEAVRSAEQKLDTQIQDTLVDKAATCTEAHTSFVENADGTITVTRTAEYREQIGAEQAVDAL